MIECPYCNYENEHDGESYKEDYPYQMECGECEKNFIFKPHHDVTFDAQEAPCLNGGEHDFRPTITYPKAFTKMQCEHCEEKRSPSDDERVKYKIPTMEDYRKETAIGAIKC